jgi:adenylate kinase
VDEETRAEFAALRKQMSDQNERLINQIKSLSHDFQNTKGFLLNDALTLGQRVTLVENRVDNLEKALRKPPG